MPKTVVKKTSPKKKATPKAEPARVKAAAKKPTPVKATAKATGSAKARPAAKKPARPKAAAPAKTAKGRTRPRAAAPVRAVKGRARAHVTSRKTLAPRKAAMTRTAPRASDGGKKTCPGWRILLGEYALGTIADADRKRLERHLESCPICAAELNQIQGLYQLLAPFDLVRPSDSFVERLAGALSTATVMEEPAAVISAEASPGVMPVEEPIVAATPAFIAPPEPAFTPVLGEPPAPVYEPRVEETRVPAPAFAYKEKQGRPWWRAPWLVPAFGGAVAGTILLVVFVKVWGPGDAGVPLAPVIPTPAEVAKEVPPAMTTLGEKDAGVGVLPPRDTTSKGAVAADDVVPLTEESTESERPIALGAGERDAVSETLLVPAEVVGVDEKSLAKYKETAGDKVDLARGAETSGGGMALGTTPRFEAVAGRGKKAAVDGWMEDRIADDIERLTTGRSATTTAAIFEYVTPNGSVVTYVTELPPAERRIVLSRLKAEKPAVTELEEANGY